METHQSCVAMLGVEDRSHVVVCTVPSCSLRRGLNLLTACLQTGGETFAAVVWKVHHFPLISSITLSIPLFGKELFISGLIPGSIKMQLPLLVDLLIIPSILFHFGIVSLPPLVDQEAATEHISDGKLAPLTRKLANLHHMEGVIQVLQIFKIITEKAALRKIGDS